MTLILKENNYFSIYMNFKLSRVHNISNKERIQVFPGFGTFEHLILKILDS